VMFVTSDHLGDALIRNNGFRNISLETQWKELERDGLDEVIGRFSPELLLVDSYFVTEAYLSTLSSVVPVAYIDDMNSAIWNVDFLINYNIFGTVMDYSGYEKTRTKLILGPRYAPLRDEFQNSGIHEIHGVKNIMVSAGGSDPEGITEKIIENVCDELKDIVFHFIVGALNPRLRIIQALAAARQNVILHINEKRMAERMKSCDIAISAAGSTLYELSACGTPTITYALADNQLIATDEFDKQGVMLSAGDCRNNGDFIAGLTALTKRLIDDAELRSEMSRRMQAIVDGNGASRIVNKLLGTTDL